MSLHDRIETDLRAAMKARDRPRTAALRLAVAALKNRSVADGVGPQGRLSDDTVAQVLTTEVKRRREAAAAFRSGGREESAQAEEAEAAVYEAYLPDQLDDAEIARVVDEVVAGIQTSGPAAMGPVMKAVMARVAGRADGARVSAVVRDRLAGDA